MQINKYIYYSFLKSTFINTINLIISHASKCFLDTC